MFGDEKFYSKLRAITPNVNSCKGMDNMMHYKYVKVEEARTKEHKFRYYGYDFEEESAREIPKGLLKKLLIVKLSILLLYYKF